MKVSIISRVPTVYQYDSLAAFGMDIRKSLYGGFSARMDFDTKEEAKEYLRDIATHLAENEEEFRKMILDINKRGILSYDAATAFIRKFSDFENY